MTSLGKVRDYDGDLGHIVDEKNEYLFFNKDIENNEKINIGDLVNFRAEIYNNTPRAYFVCKYKDKIKLKDNK